MLFKVVGENCVERMAKQRIGLFVRTFLPVTLVLQAFSLLFFSLLIFHDRFAMTGKAFVAFSALDIWNVGTILLWFFTESVAVILLGVVMLAPRQNSLLLWFGKIVFGASVFLWMTIVAGSWVARIVFHRFIVAGDLALFMYAVDDYGKLFLEEGGAKFSFVLAFLSLILFLVIFILRRIQSLKVSNLLLFTGVVIVLASSSFVVTGRLDTLTHKKLQLTPQLAIILSSFFPDPDLEHSNVILNSGLYSESERRIESPSEPRSVFIFVVEALRRDSLVSSRSEDGPPMPFLASVFEKECSSFPHAYAQASDTELSMEAILSSLYPERNAAADPFPSARFTLLEAFSRVGYVTGYLSVFEWGSTLRRIGQKYVDFISNPTYYGWSEILDERIRSRVGLKNSVVIHPLRRTAEADHYNFEKFKEWVISNRGAPKLGVMYFFSSHFPYTPSANDKVSAISHYPYLPYFFPREEKDLWFLRYEQSLGMVDNMLKEMFDFLASEALLENSVIVITSDHGEEFYENGHFLHAAQLSAPVMNIPLCFMNLPKDCLAKESRDYPVGHIDIAPTIVDVLTQQTIPNFQGKSICRREGIAERPFFVTAQATRMQDAVYFGKWKYIYSHDGQAPQLYNLEDDRFELNNVIDENLKIESELENVVKNYRRTQNAFYDPRLPWRETHLPPQYENLTIAEQ